MVEYILCAKVATFIIPALFLTISYKALELLSTLYR